ncbi:MAG: creatininase family protein [Firmicutes bacterium]|nr:creatininase family protein [Bacillota bacterium]MCM1401476.1 creatininase family protein [Bacteroides sp.]MCM1477411.1 creatininase family protein [Bacteroides sp.]
METSLKTIDLSISNYGTARQLNYDIALLPWGATEPHNLHLPYLTDAILSHDIAVDAAVIAREKFGINAMVLPPMPLGSQNPGQRELPFCIHYRYDTQRAVLTDIASSLDHQGLHRLVIVNGHGGNTFKNMIRDLAVDLPTMLIAAGEWYRAAPAKEYFDQPGDHADELETSVMMHYHPELVNLDEAGHGGNGGFKGEALGRGVAWLPRNWSRMSTDTGIGDPALATAEKGARFARVCAEAFAQVIYDLCQPDLYK